MVSINYFCLTIVICLDNVIWFLVTNNNPYVISKLIDHSRGQPEGFLSNSYYTEM